LLLTQREPDSPGRNSISGRSFHHCAEDDQKSRVATWAMSLPTQYVSRELVSAFLPMTQVENRRVRARKDERDRASPHIDLQQRYDLKTHLLPNFTKAECTGSAASTFLRRYAQNVMKKTGWCGKIHRKRGGSFGYSRTRVL